jgi:hypothetical protein
VQKGSSWGLTSLLAVGHLAPLAERAHHQDRYDRHSRSGRERTNEQSQSLGDTAVTLALQSNQRVADHGSGEPA